MDEKSKVAIHCTNEFIYPDKSPFHPSERFPEYRFSAISKKQNKVYCAVRNSLYLLGLDKERYGTKEWNPMREIMEPGETVLIKPNLIASKQPKNGKFIALITHGSVIRAVIDYVYLGLNGKGKIIIADGPQEDSDIDGIKSNVGITAIQEFYVKNCGFLIEFYDLRTKHLLTKDGIYEKTIDLPGDPKGNVKIDLKEKSYFSELDGQGKNYYGAYYDIDETNRHHSNRCHEYMVSRSALDADVFISVPKLKTHKKVGVTINLKGLVGINGKKNWLPHYAIGSPSKNGDQFNRESLRSSGENAIVVRAKKMLLNDNSILRYFARKLKGPAYKIFGSTDKVIRSGNWYGNDTCWRMVLDLNRILLYYNGEGTITNRKRYLSIVDGIIGMDGAGPIDGDAKDAGIIACGIDPLAVDIACSTLIGFDFHKIKMLNRAFEKDSLPISNCSADAIELVSNKNEFNSPLLPLIGKSKIIFRPHFAWSNIIADRKN